MWKRKSNSSRNKVSVSGNLRYILLGIIVLGVIICMLMLLRMLTEPAVYQEERSILHYQADITSSYEVNLANNRYVPGTTMEMDETYISRIVDAILIRFQIGYKGDETAHLKGTYEVATSLRGYQSSEGTKEILWELVTEQQRVDIDESGKLYDKTQEVAVALPDYKNEAAMAADALGITTSCEICVTMNGVMVVEKDGISEEIPIVQEIVIPVTEGLFTIEHNEAMQLADTLGSQVELIRPVDKAKAALYIAAIMLLIAAGLFLLLGVRALTTEEQRERKERKILKGYKGRLIELKDIPKMEWKASFAVSSMNELVKLSDELRRPILYIPGKNEAKECFLVIDDNQKYSLQGL